MTITREEFAALLSEDGYDITDPTEAVPLAALIVGPNVKRIASFLGRPRAWCADAARSMRANGVWRGGKIGMDDPEAGPDNVEIALWSLMARGMIEAA